MHDMKLKAYLRTIAPNALIFICGSASLPYIVRRHDLDIMVLYETEEEYQRLRQCKRELFSGRLDLHLRSKYEPTPIELWVYQCYFRPVDPGRSINIYDPTTKRQLLQQCIDCLKQYRYSGHPQKAYYHIYTLLAMWRNQNHQLTREDIDHINHFHDRCPSDAEMQLLYQLARQIAGTCEGVNYDI